MDTLSVWGHQCQPFCEQWLPLPWIDDRNGWTWLMWLPKGYPLKQVEEQSNSWLVWPLSLIWIVDTICLWSPNAKIDIPWTHSILCTALLRKAWIWMSLTWHLCHGCPPQCPGRMWILKHLPFCANCAQRCIFVRHWGGKYSITMVHPDGAVIPKHLVQRYPMYNSCVHWWCCVRSTHNDYHKKPFVNICLANLLADWLLKLSPSWRPMSRSLIILPILQTLDMILDSIGLWIWSLTASYSITMNSHVH